MAGIRRSVLGGVLALALTAGALPAQAETPELNFTWPENPFAFTLPEDTFTPTGENRFEKTARVFSETLGTVGEDLFDIATYPLHDPVTFGTFALGVGALVLADKPLTIAYQEAVIPIGEAFDLPRIVPKSYGVFNDGAYLLAASAGGMVYGLAANDERAQVAAILSAKAIAYSYLTSHVVLKPLFGRVRPVDDLSTATGPSGDFTNSPFEWFRSDGIHFASTAYATGMPSFHLTMYFATARVWSGVYDNYLIPYAAAGALALANAEGHHHWVSDMVAGALIGTGIGNVVLHNYYDEHNKTFGSVVPVVSSEGIGLNWTMTF